MDKRGCWLLGAGRRRTVLSRGSLVAIVYRSRGRAVRRLRVADRRRNHCTLRCGRRFRLCGGHERRASRLAAGYGIGCLRMRTPAQRITQSKEEPADQNQAEEDDQQGCRAERDLAVVVCVGRTLVSVPVCAVARAFVQLFLVFGECSSHGACVSLLMVSVLRRLGLWLP